MSNLVAWIGGAAWFFWSVSWKQRMWGACSPLTRPELAQLSFTWLFLSWLFIDGIFLVREAQLAPPALQLWEDEEMGLGEGAELLLRQCQECQGSSEPAWQCPWPGGGACREASLLEGDETAQSLSVAVEGSSEPSAWTWGKKCAVSAR